MDLARTVLNNYNCLWGASGSQYDFGAVDKVSVSGGIQTKELKVGTIGDTVLGRRVIGSDWKITIAAREIDATLKQKMFPWWSSGAIPLLPATVHKDLYDYAQILTLHPNHLAGGTVTQDYNFVKAVPMISDSSRDGVADGVDVIDFFIFPDRTQLPTLVYGYIGAIPA